MNYRCIIADDRITDRDLLQLLLERTGMVDIVAVCSNGMEAYQAITSFQVDLVITDVDMPYLTGIELVKSLRQQPVFIFVSAFNEYAADGFELDVADFIVKPLQQERLLRALEKARKFITLKQQPVEMASFSYKNNPDGRFFIRVSDGLICLHESEIVYLESAGNFSKIYTLSGECHITLVSLKNMVLQLPEDNLIRIHRQYVVNLQHIRDIEPAAVKMCGLQALPLAQAHRQEVLDRVDPKTIHRHIT